MFDGKRDRMLSLGRKSPAVNNVDVFTFMYLSSHLFYSTKKNVFPFLQHLSPTPPLLAL